MLLQGLRPDEVLRLEPEHIDLGAKTLRVVLGKSRASRRKLDLTAESVSILGRRLALADQWIFPGRKRDQHYTYSGLVGAHNRALTESGTSFDIYSLRHTFATRFYRATKDLDALRRILGHGDLKTIMRYVHEDREQLREAMRKYEETVVWTDVEGLQ